MDNQPKRNSLSLIVECDAGFCNLFFHLIIDIFSDIPRSEVAYTEHGVGGTFYPFHV